MDASRALKRHFHVPSGLPFAYPVNVFAFDPLHPLQSRILEVVGRRPEISIADLHAELKKKRSHAISLQHLYRILTKMTDEQMLVKVKSSVSVNLMWMSYVEFFAQRCQRTSLEQLQRVGGFPLEPGRKKTFEVHSLAALETMWNHVLVELYRITQVKDLYKYYSHAWWQLTDKGVSPAFYAALQEKGILCRWLFGNGTALDRGASQRISAVFPALIALDPPFPREGYNLNVYGEYIIECILPERIASHLSFFFERVKSPEQFDQELFLDLFSMKADCKLTVWRNAKQAETMAAKIGRYFK